MNEIQLECDQNQLGHKQNPIGVSTKTQPEIYCIPIGASQPN